MIRLTRAQTEPIGLEIGSGWIRMMQLDRSGQAPRVRAAYVAETSGPQRADAIARVLHAGKFRGKRIVASLPGEIAHVRTARLSVTSDLRAAVHDEARRTFPFDPSEAQLQFIHAGEVRHGGERRNEVILVAARTADVLDVLEQLESTGASVESLDFGPCALYRSVERLSDAERAHAILEIGARSSNLVIGCGSRIQLIKPIAVGNDDINHAVSRKLGISVEEARALRRRLFENGGVPSARRDPVRQAVVDASRTTIESLVKTVVMCLRYHAVTFRGVRPDTLLLTGSGADDAHLRSLLAGCLPMAVETVKPSVDVDGAAREWSVALGLALTGVAPRAAISQVAAA